MKAEQPTPFWTKTRLEIVLSYVILVAGVVFVGTVSGNEYIALGSFFVLQILFSVFFAKKNKPTVKNKNIRGMNGKTFTNSHAFFNFLFAILSGLIAVGITSFVANLNTLNSDIFLIAGVLSFSLLARVYCFIKDIPLRTFDYSKNVNSSSPHSYVPSSSISERDNYPGSLRWDGTRGYWMD